MDPKILREKNIEQCFSENDWLMEVKYPGRRIQCLIDHKNEVLFAGRYGREANENISDFRWKFSKVYEDIKKMNLPVGTLLDGEIYSKVGPSVTFQIINSKVDDSINFQKKYGFVTYALFDLIYFNNKSYVDSPIESRKKQLHQVVRSTMNIELTETWVKQKDKNRIWTDILNSTQEEKGVIFKLSNSTYKSARSDDWVKHKCIKTYDAIVTGIKLDKNELAASVEVSQYRGNRPVKVANVCLSTLEQKEDFAKNDYIGKVIEFSATAKTNKSYKNPIAVANCLRLDKKPESCMWSE